MFITTTTVFFHYFSSVMACQLMSCFFSWFRLHNQPISITDFFGKWKPNILTIYRSQPTIQWINILTMFFFLADDVCLRIFFVLIKFWFRLKKTKNQLSHEWWEANLVFLRQDYYITDVDRKLKTLFFCKLPEIKQNTKKGGVIVFFCRELNLAANWKLIKTSS